MTHKKVAVKTRRKHSGEFLRRLSALQDDVVFLGHGLHQLQPLGKQGADFVGPGVRNFPFVDPLVDGNPGYPEVPTEFHTPAAAKHG
jgi:hypothetical protein